MCLGNLLSIGGTLAPTVGAENPMRYRGYYYDTETGLYYLQSRYYNPDWGRFISQDEAQYHESMTGAAANLYAYGNNNPVMMSDPDGHSTLSTILNIASIVISFLSLNPACIIPKLWIAFGLGVFCAVMTIYDYNYAVSHLNNKASNYQTELSECNFWLILGLISAAIQMVCSILPIIFKELLLETSVLGGIIGAFGFTRGYVLGKILLVNDLVNMINGTFVWKPF